MKTTELHSLFQKYIQGVLTLDEVLLFQEYLENKDNEPVLEELIERVLADESIGEQQHFDVDSIVANIEVEVRERIVWSGAHRYRVIRQTWHFVAASIVALFVGLGYYVVTFNANGDRDALGAPVVSDIEPGKNRAVLTLANGNTIVLSESQECIQLVDDGIMYTDGTRLRKDLQRQLVTMSVPRGGQYQLILSDGTKVWLNAGSRLTYPTQFDVGERLVDLDGEAYFDVMHHPTRPFIVRSHDHVVHVKGTRFNISAYSDESAITTTLVDGSVVLNHKNDTSFRVLRPGEQSVWEDSAFSIKKVDVAPFTGWKDGLLVFSEADLPAILRQIERWYDVEFEMPTLPRTETVYGEVRRDVNISEILHVLELNYGVTFKREGRRIVVNK